MANDDNSTNASDLTNDNFLSNESNLPYDDYSDVKQVFTRTSLTHAQAPENLMHAIVNHKDELSLNSLINGSDLNYQDDHGRTYLMAAISSQNHQAVSKLIDAGADIDMQDDNGYSALMLACLKKNKVLVNTLLDAGANIDLKTTDSNFSAYDLSVESNDPELFAIFKNKKPSNPSDDFVEFVQNGHYEEAKDCFQKNNVDINHTDVEGRTAAIYTAVNTAITANMDEKLEFLKFLKENGANLTIQDTRRKEALDYALENHAFAMSQYLLGSVKRYVNINVFNVVDDRLLDRLYQDDFSDIADLLITQALDKGNLFITSKDSEFFDNIRQSLLKTSSINSEDDIDTLITLSNSEIMLESIYAPQTHYVKDIDPQAIKQAMVDSLTTTPYFEHTQQFLPILQAICNGDAITYTNDMTRKEHELIIKPLESPDCHYYFIFEFDHNDRPKKLSICSGSNYQNLRGRDDDKTYGVITYPIDPNRLQKFFPDGDMDNCKTWLPEALMEPLKGKKFFELHSEEGRYTPLFQAVDKVFELNDFLPTPAIKPSILCKAQIKDNDVAKATNIALRFLLNKQDPKMVFDTQFQQERAGHDRYKEYKKALQMHTTDAIFGVAKQNPIIGNRLDERAQELCNQTQIHGANKGDWPQEDPSVSIKSQETQRFSPGSVQDRSIID